MPYTQAHFDFSQTDAKTALAQDLGLKNLGLSIYSFAAGEGFDFFHNHREQEEVYICLDGEATLQFRGESNEQITLKRGDIVRVAPETQRAIGNLSGAPAVVLIAGACPHPYPAGVGHHDVIADVLTICGQGETAFTLPKGMDKAPPADDDNC